MSLWTLYKKISQTLALTFYQSNINVTSQHQREEFARQMQEQLNMPGIRSDDWGDLFWHLANYTKEGKILIIFDEINWMGDKDPTFLYERKIRLDDYISL